MAVLLSISPVLAMDTARPEEGLMNATLWGSSGKEVALDRWRGKPVILFYEDRHSTTLNEGFKQALFTQGQSLGLTDAVWVLPVANLEGFNFFPARDIALSHVRAEEKKWGLPILVDLTGVLGRSPWDLPRKNSTVVLLDAGGRRVFHHSGRMGTEDISEFFRMLRPLLGLPGAPAPEAHP